MAHVWGAEVGGSLVDKEVIRVFRQFFQKVRPTRFQRSIVDRCGVETHVARSITLPDLAPFFSTSNHAVRWSAGPSSPTDQVTCHRGGSCAAVVRASRPIAWAPLAESDREGRRLRGKAELRSLDAERRSRSRPEEWDQPGAIATRARQR